MSDPETQTELSPQLRLKLRSLRVELAGVAFLGGCILWDRFMYAAGYRIDEEFQHFTNIPFLCTTILVVVLSCRLVLLRRGGLALAAVRFAILLVVAWCVVSRVGHDPFMKGFRDRIRATVDPHELQAWATAIIPNETPKEGDVIRLPNGKEIHLTGDAVDPGGLYFSLPPDSLPESIRLKLERTPGILVWQSGNVSRRHVELIFGRRWGLYVGPPFFADRAEDEWIPGVYFYSAPN